jgi:hypothetical protein
LRRESQRQGTWEARLEVEHLAHSGLTVFGTSQANFFETRFWTRVPFGFRVSDHSKEVFQPHLHGSVRKPGQNFSSANPVKTAPPDHRDEIISALTATVLEEHHLSGAAAGYNVRKEAVEAMKFYAASNVFTGVLREVFEKLQKKLSLE